MKISQGLVIMCVLFAVACGQSTDTENNNNHTDSEPIAKKECGDELEEFEIDYHTLSNYQEVYTTHTHLDIEVNFDNKIISGTVSHDITNVCGVDKIIFDSRDLDIQSITLNDGEETTFEFGEYDELLGTPITVAINENTTKVNIAYATTEDTRALDWLSPELTAGKQFPYMYTQGEAVLTRTWIPIQDTPARRITYSAKVKVPPHLLPVMSASNAVEKNETGVYEFKMEQSIPSYLMAIAVGDLDFVAIDERTGIYSEPSMIEACAFEFAKMGEMVDIAETLYGDYQWDRYDVIVLPPSFPFGGMENPRLTFATPTLIAGDRSLTSVIAHELAHSWSGNLVTNSTWNDFWLNEGFTVYFERRIMEELYSRDHVEMLALLGRQDLAASMESLKPEMQMLKLKMKGINPDDAMTDVAYEKGYFFLRLLEETAGREIWDAFLKSYFNEHKFQTMTTEGFISYLKGELIEPNGLELNIDEWVYSSGVPENCPKVTSVLFENVEAKLEAFYAGGEAKDFGAGDWTTQEWLHCIRHLREGTTVDQMAKLDAEFKLTESGNAEIAAIWFEKSIEFGYDEIDEALEAFLMKVGRRKFLQPIYQTLANVEGGKEKALEIYKKARGNYHYVSVETIDGILGYEG